MMFTFRFCVKIFANLSKVVCRAIYFIIPKWRVSLPGRSDAILKTKGSVSRIGVVWQTNFTNRVTIPIYLNYLFNRFLSPSFQYRFMATAERELFIRENCSQRIFDAYSRIQIGAAQADFWRVLVLQKYGGVYMDIDAHLVWPLEKILTPDQEELFLQIKTGEISNYFIASKPNNPNLAAIIDQIVENIENETSENVYDLTGPGVFNKVLGDRNVPKRYYLYTCNQGNFTNEYFQYIDKPQGKWTKEQKKTAVLKPKADVKH
jgi:mannosyltransferase OCH1-like enzyme